MAGLKCVEEICLVNLFLTQVFTGVNALQFFFSQQRFVKKLVSLWFPDALPRDLPCQTTYPCVVSFILTRMIYTEAELGTSCLFVETGLTLEKKYKIRSHSSLLLFINVTYDIYDVIPDLGIYVSPNFFFVDNYFLFYFTYLFYISAMVSAPSSPSSTSPIPTQLPSHNTFSLTAN